LRKKLQRLREQVADEGNNAALTIEHRSYISNSAVPANLLLSPMLRTAHRQKAQVIACRLGSLCPLPTARDKTRMAPCAVRA
jgi:hypothetical protein